MKHGSGAAELSVGIKDVMRKVVYYLNIIGAIIAGLPVVLFYLARVMLTEDASESRAVKSIDLGDTSISIRLYGDMQSLEACLLILIAVLLILNAFLIRQNKECQQHDSPDSEGLS